MILEKFEKENKELKAQLNFKDGYFLPSLFSFYVRVFINECIMLWVWLFCQIVLLK